MPFLNLFRSKGSSPDGLTQPQREAIVDLLHYCLYADSHIALAEIKLIDDTVTTFSWDPAIAFSDYENRSIAAARHAKEDAGYRDEFIASVRQRLDHPTVRQRALEVCRQLIVADGTRTAAESDALRWLQQSLA